MDQLSLANLQYPVSHTQPQSQALSHSSKVLQYVSESTNLASHGLMSDKDREKYKKEFISLKEQLNDLSNAKIGSKNLFGPGFGGVDFINNADGLDDSKKIGLIDVPDNESIFVADVGRPTDLNDANVIPDGGNSCRSVKSASYSGSRATSIFNDFTGAFSWIGWLTESKDAASLAYGWWPKSYPFTIIIESAEPVGGSVAYLPYPYNTMTVRRDVQRFALRENDLGPPYFSGDRMIAHEMVHTLQTQNICIGDLTGNGKSSANWLKEGFADSTQRGDSRVKDHLGSHLSGDEIQDLYNTTGSGNEDWSSSVEYAAAYLALCFLHIETPEACCSDGVQHMTTWMTAQFDSDEDSFHSGLNADVSTSLSSRYYSYNDELIFAFNSGFGLEPIAGSTRQKLEMEYISKNTLARAETCHLETADSALETLSKFSSLIENESTEIAKSALQ